MGWAQRANDNPLRGQPRKREISPSQRRDNGVLKSILRVLTSDVGEGRAKNHKWMISKFRKRRKTNAHRPKSV
jgi:hypothetical protein